MGRRLPRDVECKRNQLIKLALESRNGELDVEIARKLSRLPEFSNSTLYAIQSKISATKKRLGLHTRTYRKNGEQQEELEHAKAEIARLTSENQALAASLKEAACHDCMRYQAEKDSEYTNIKQEIGGLRSKLLSMSEEVRALRAQRDRIIAAR